MDQTKMQKEPYTQIKEKNQKERTFGMQIVLNRTWWWNNLGLLVRQMQVPRLQ